MDLDLVRAASADGARWLRTAAASGAARVVGVAVETLARCIALFHGAGR